jgi:hypothetical protein
VKIPPARDLRKFATAAAAIAAQAAAAGYLHGNVLHATQLAAAVLGLAAVYTVPGPQRSERGANSVTPLPSPPCDPPAVTGPLSPSTLTPKGAPVSYSVSLTGQLADPAAETALFDKLNAITADPANGVTAAGGVHTDGTPAVLALPPAPAPAPTPIERLTAALDAFDTDPSGAAYPAFIAAARAALAELAAEETAETVTAAAEPTHTVAL